MNLRKLAGRLAGALGLLLALSLVLVPAPVLAVPQGGHVFYGTVIAGGVAAPQGTAITAKVAGLEYTTAVDSQGRYGYTPVFNIPADDPDTPTREGASPGNPVEFYIAGTRAQLYDVVAGQSLDSYPFRISGATKLNLSISVLSLTAEAGGPYSGTTGASVALSGNASGGTPPYTYAWDLDNNGTYETPGKDVSHSWSSAGIYTIGLQVTDNATATATDNATVTVTAPTLTAEAGGPYSGTTGASIAISGSASGGTPPYAYAWDLDNDGEYDDATSNTTSRSWSTAGTYTIRLRVTDNATAMATDNATVTITTAAAGGGAAPAPSGPVVVSPGVVDVTKVVTTNGVFTQLVSVKSDDAKVELNIPKDTIGKTIDGDPISRISATSMADPPEPPAGANVITLTYNLGPHDATFNPPITLTFTYDPTKIPTGVNEKDLVVYRYDEATSKWVELTGYVVDTAANTVSVSLASLSKYSIFARAVAAPPVALPIAAPAAFSVSNLMVQPAEVQPNAAVSISVLVANTGGTEGSYTVVLNINGVKEAEKSVTIAGGGSQTATFSVTREETGSYSVTIGNLSASFTVVPAAVTPPTQPEEPETPVKPSVNWLLIAGIIAAVVVVILLAYFLIVRRRAA